MLDINIINCTNQIYDKTIRQVLNKAVTFINNKGSINVVLVNDETIKAYNKKYRNKDYATDVLSFVDGENSHLGDLIISLEKCEEQRIEYKHSFERELSFLTLHGYLHLSGYDHIDINDEKEMFTMQDKILNSLNITR